MKNSMKKISLLFAIVIMAILFTVSASALDATGQCGDDVYWSLNKTTGELTISGTGDMYMWDNWVSGYSPFYDNQDIKSVVIKDGVTSIGDGAFSGCSSLISITIPDSVTSIGYGAFYECTSLTSITIPDSVTSIEGNAFYNCTNLTSITFPDSVTSIGERAFYDTAYYNNSDNWENDVLYIGKHLIKAKESISGDYNIKKGSLTIAGSAFNFCDSLTSVTIPDSVTTIGERAFYSCDSLTSVTIPGSVTTIGDYAFYNCYSLTSVTIPDSVTTIGEWAFTSCGSLTSVTIPDSVTTIGVDAFYNCDSLASIVVDINNSAYSNDSRGVLFNKNKTILIQYPVGNTGTSYTIPDSVTTIGEWAFVSCGSLTSVTIPDSVTTIGDYAFYNCESLTSVTIPDSVISIGEGAFYSCESLTSVTIPDSVTTIGDYAFYNCDSLTSVTIHDSVTTIGYMAFYNCDSLTDVYYKGTEEQWKEMSIGSSNYDLLNATIHYNHNHTYKKIVTVPLTCTAKGYTTYTCDCGDTYTETIAANGHTDSEWIIDKVSTCSAEGSKHIECTVCEKVLKTEAIAKLSHNMGAYVVTKQASCIEKGTEKSTCSQCGYYTEKTIDKTQHNYQDGVCKVCHKTKVENCSHMCHKKGFMGFIWKIVRFFWKLFKMNPVCDCEARHY